MAIEVNETLRLNPQNAWLFDVDGVVTNPTEKEVTQPQLIPEIVKRLEASEPVAIVSGRALPWLLKQVISGIETSVNDKKVLENLFVSAEFGGVSIHFKDGQEAEVIDENVSLPHELIDEARSIVENEYSDITFIDPDKVTHFTAEMIKGVQMEKFKEGQNELAAKLRTLVRKYTKGDEIEVHNDRIATNVKNKKLNKHLATQKVLEWLNDRGIEPQMFHVFGDQISDLEMGRELHSEGKNLRFIYVGENHPGEMPFEVIHQGEVDLGTVKYLISH